MSRKEPKSEPAQPKIRLQSLSYVLRDDLLPELGAAIAAAGGWVLEHRPLSADAIEVRLEIPVQALPGIYGALLASGLHLTRDSHRTLAERCNCDLHQRPRLGVAAYLLIQLEVQFLPEPPLDRLPLPANGTLD